MDFSAWFEVYLSGRWYSFDARHNQRRMGRIMIGRGREAADVPIITTFGPHRLEKLEIVTNKISIQEQSNSEVGGGEMPEVSDEPWVVDKLLACPIRNKVWSSLEIEVFREQLHHPL